MTELGPTAIRIDSAKSTQGSPDMIPGNGHLRLLVVDDDPLNQNIMELMLAPLGYKLEYACDGAEALEAIKTKPYDLVFMDLMLPDLSGRDVCRQVRVWEAGRRHVPIVAVTGFDMPGQPLELFKAGMDDYIFKPYDLRGITRIINLYAKGDGHDGATETDPTKAAPGAETPVLDTAGSLADFSNDVEGYKELLRDFLAGLPGRLDRMHRAHEAGDFERLNRECHTLKGVSAGLGAMRLSRLATQLGRSCADGQRASAGPLLEQVEQAISELQAVGQEFLQS
jgi:two-component system sensor histidine kinase/response regulator